MKCIVFTQFFYILFDYFLLQYSLKSIYIYLLLNAASIFERYTRQTSEHDGPAWYTPSRCFENSYPLLSEFYSDWQTVCVYSVWFL